MPGKFTLRLGTVLLALGLCAGAAHAQLPAPNLDSFGLKIFKVESGLYPFVQVYFRTFDQNMRPLINLNERNLGIMVQGKSYDPAKRQYVVNTIRNRDEAVRVVFVIDTSKTMTGAPFEAALEAAARFVEGKRPQDQVAIVATSDNTEGYNLVSAFERDPKTLVRRMADLRADGNTTRLYDSIGAAMQMSGMVSQGGIASTDAQYVLSTSIVVFSDGKDEGSAVSRTELMDRITSLPVPIPVYSLAYSKVGPEHLLNLQALSKNSFGIYYPIGETVADMTRCVEEIQNILQNDYVVTLRAYQEPDGNTYPIKVGVEYPSNSGRIVYQSGQFEAIMPPPIPELQRMIAGLNEKLPPIPSGNPYFDAQTSGAGFGGAAPSEAP